MDNKENAAQEPIRIIVSGPSGSGKTALVALIADLLAHTANFEKVQVVYPEEVPEDMKAKATALVMGKMNRLIPKIAVITECEPLNFGKPGTREFTGKLRRGNAYQYYDWHDAADLARKDFLGIQAGSHLNARVSQAAAVTPSQEPQSSTNNAGDTSGIG